MAMRVFKVDGIPHGSDVSPWPGETPRQEMFPRWVAAPTAGKGPLGWERCPGQPLKLRGSEVVIQPHNR